MNTNHLNSSSNTEPASTSFCTRFRLSILGKVPALGCLYYPTTTLLSSLFWDLRLSRVVLTLLQCSHETLFWDSGLSRNVLTQTQGSHETFFWDPRLSQVVLTYPKSSHETLFWNPGLSRNVPTPTKLTRPSHETIPRELFAVRALRWATRYVALVEPQVVGYVFAHIQVGVVCWDSDNWIACRYIFKAYNKRRNSGFIFFSYSKWQIIFHAYSKSFVIVWPTQDLSN